MALKRRGHAQLHAGDGSYALHQGRASVATHTSQHILASVWTDLVSLTQFALPKYASSARKVVCIPVLKPVCVA